MVPTVDRAVSRIVADPGVYAPQRDSMVLLGALVEAALPTKARVLDLCTGSGVIAVGAAAMGAGEVIAFDIDPDAVRCARRNAEAAGVRVDARQGGLPEALAEQPFDIVLCNPPYVPAEPGGPRVLAWDAGLGGRLLLDPLCGNAHTLLRDGGSVLMVHSEFSAPDDSLAQLRATGLKASVVARQTIDFGPVMHERAAWLEEVGALEPGRRKEELVVIRGDRMDNDGG